MVFPVGFMAVMCTAIHFIVQLFIIMSKKTLQSYMKQPPGLQGSIKISALVFYFPLVYVIHCLFLFSHLFNIFIFIILCSVY